MLRNSILLFALTAATLAYAKTDITSEAFKVQFEKVFSGQSSIEHAQFQRADAYLKAAGYAPESSALEENLDIYAAGCVEVSPQCEDQAFTYRVGYKLGEQRATLLDVGGVAIHPRTKNLILIREQMVRLCFDEVCDPVGLNSDLKN